MCWRGILVQCVGAVILSSSGPPIFVNDMGVGAPPCLVMRLILFCVLGRYYSFVRWRCVLLLRAGTVFLSSVLAKYSCLVCRHGVLA